MQKRHLSVREFAAAYGIAVNTVYAMCAANKIAHVRLGTGRGTIRIPEDAVMPEEGKTERRPEVPAASKKAKRVKLRHLRPPS